MSTRKNSSQSYSKNNMHNTFSNRSSEFTLNGKGNESRRDSVNSRTKSSDILSNLYGKGRRNSSTFIEKIQNEKFNQNKG